MPDGTPACSCSYFLYIYKKQKPYAGRKKNLLRGKTPCPAGMKRGEILEEIYRLFIPSITEGMFRGFILLIQACITCIMRFISRPDVLTALLLISAYAFINNKLNKLNL